MTEAILHLDFETRSTVDLRKTGVHKYAEHPDTGIWLASWAFDGEEPRTTWFLGPYATPSDVESSPIVAFERVLDHVANGGVVYAHNAEFERVMWREVLARIFPGIVVPKLEQWYDTAAEAAAMALPRSLDRVANVLGLSQRKDAKGGRVMLQLSRPRKLGEDGKPIWWEDTAKLDTLATYGLQDVRTERAVYGATRRLGTRERAIYMLDQRINDRGVELDLPLIRAMKSLAEQEIDAQDSKLYEATEGVVEATTKVAQIKAWLATRGVNVSSIDKAHIRELLERSDLPEDVATVLTARAEAAKSSTKKLAKMLDVVGRDGRARGTLLYHAASTGRWAGRTIQPQNFPRGEVKNIETYIQSVIDGSIVGREGVSVLTVLSSMLRSTIVAHPGYDLVVADFAAIEARGVAWAAQEHDLLEAFRNGRPIYKEMAAEIYGIPVESIEKGTMEYQIGKNTILGAGYGMGGKPRNGEPSKFQQMVKLQTGIEISDDFSAHAIDTYRKKYPKIKDLWYATDRAAIKAVENPGEVFRAGPVRFTSRGAYLWMILPSGRALAYFQPKIVERETPWGDVRPAVEVWHENQMTRQWERTALYGGLLVENEVQAISRDIMADGMLAVEADGYPVILTVHDELVSEVPEDTGSLERYIALITKTPEWAPGFPVAAEGWRGKRYRK